MTLLEIVTGSKLEDGKSVTDDDTEKESWSVDDSSDLGLTGRSKSAEMGVRVEVDEHDDVDEFDDIKFGGESESD